jgi:putative endonuclease
MMSDRRQRLGRAGEESVAQYLIGAGHELVCRNWRCPAGEVDIVTREGEWLVLVEVRARSSRRFGAPEESITPAKRATLLACGQYLVAELAWEGSWRIDVAAVELGPAGKPGAIRIIPHAVEA